MSKKENEREVTSLLARIRESLRRPKKEAAEETQEDTFDRELSERLGKHLEQEDELPDLREGEDEPEFAVDELEIVADGALDPEELEEDSEDAKPLPDEETVAAAEQALFSDLDALMARMTPEQRARFEEEMNAADGNDEADIDESVGEEGNISAEEEPTEEAKDESIVIAMPDQADTLRFDEVDEQSDKPAKAEAKKLKSSVRESAVEEVPEPVEEIPADEIAEPAEETVSEEIEEGEVYTMPEADEDYDLSDAEAFRALEARMTAEQRAQFEQALAEAQEAERAEKAARKEAARLAAQERAMAEAAAGSEADVTTAVSDEAAENVSVQNDTVEVASAEEPTESLTAEPQVTEIEEEPIAVEMAPAEEEIHTISSVEDENAPIETPIFMAVDEDDPQDDMPAIKLGAEPSAFTLVVEPEPESEPEPEPDEEEMLAALLARMSPEQLARFREEMLADATADEYESLEVVEETTEEVYPAREYVDDSEDICFAPEESASEAETSDLEGTSVFEPIFEEKTSASSFAYAPADHEPMIEEETVYQTAKDEPMADAPQDEEPLPEDSNEVSEEKDEDAIAAVLGDPEKLEELMSRLTPEQAAELRAMLSDTEEEPETASTAYEERPSASEMPEESEEAFFGEIVEDPEPVFAESEDESEPLWRAEDEAVEDNSTAFAEEDSTESPFDGDTDDGVAFEYEEKAEETEEEEDLEDEDDLNVFEINEDMSDEEISLMLGLGYEKELVYTLGQERVDQVKKRAARENARDPEFANAYAYEGEEYRDTDQNDRIRYRYQKDRRRLWVRLIGTSFFALLLFLYECCGVLRGIDAFDAAHYPVIAIMTGWQLLVFASAFSWKQLIHGIRSAFMLEPDNHAMTAIVVAVVMFNNILMAMVFKGSSLYLYNFPAALCLLCSVLCDLADVSREILTFEVVSSDAKKYVSESITLTAAHTSMPITPPEDEKNNPLSSKNAMYVRRVGFIKNYFRRTNRKRRHAQILNFVFLPLLAFSVVMGVVTALIGNGIAPALSSFAVSILLCMPLSYTVVHTLPLFYEARRLRKQGCAIVGEGTVEECNQFSTVVFEDRDIFPPVLIKTKGLKLYENNLIYSVILKISLLFREIGGPINEVLDLDKDEMKRFLASGRAGALEDGRVVLDSVTEDGVTAMLSDGSRVVAGSAAFLGSHGIYVRVSAKDQQLIDSGDMSILFLAFDGKLGARFYVDYQPDPEFEALAGMLHEDGFRVAVRTLDPGIHEDMIAHKCPPDMPEIGTVRAKPRELTSKPSSDARVDGGLVCTEDPRKMLLPLRAIRNLRRLNRFALRLYAIALLINMAVVIVLTACSVVGFMSSLFVSLYMLVWLATSLGLTALFLNK